MSECTLTDCGNNLIAAIQNAEPSTFNGIDEEMEDIQNSEVSPKEAAERIVRWILQQLTD